MSEPIQWGILGLGKIAASFAKDLALVPEANLKAVASRSLQKAEAFATEWEADTCYGSYQELLADPEVDVIYIATPHTLHCEQTIMALEAGKHVLCEKPLGINGEEVERMLTAAEKAGVFLMEALWSRFNPALRAAVEKIKSGELGAPKYLKADFAFPALHRDPDGRLLNPALAGGSLLDIGIYPVFLAYWVLGTPERFEAIAHFHETGIEKQIGMVFSYPDAIAMLYSGLSSKSEMKVEISCESGNLYIHPRWHETDGFEVDREGEGEVVEIPTIGKGYTYEIKEVHRCLKAGLRQSPDWSWSDSRALHNLLEAIRERCGIRFE